MFSDADRVEACLKKQIRKPWLSPLIMYLANALSG